MSASADFIGDLASRIEDASTDHQSQTRLVPFPAPNLSCCFSGKLPREPGTSSPSRVGPTGRNPQFHFSTCIDFAPHCQLSSHQCGAFSHTGQAVVPLTALTRQHRRINACSIVPHAQSELLIVIADFNLDLPCLGMPKSVPQCFGSNLVGLVTQN